MGKNGDKFKAGVIDSQALNAIDFQTLRNMKNPSLNDQSSYNETLSASLRAALGEGMGMIGAGILQDQESAQDLSMKATGHDGYVSGGFDDAELMMRIKQEVQEAYPDLDFSNHHPPAYRRSPSPHQDDHDPKGIEVKGGQMVMMPDVMENYDSGENMDEGEETIRKDEETDERNSELEKRTSLRKCSEFDEDSSREQEERQHYEDEEDECNIDRSRPETEAERELRAVQEKFEREQAEDLRNDYSLLENGYRSTVERSYSRHHHYMSLPTRFSPLNASEKEDRQRHCSDDPHFLGRSLSHPCGEDRSSSNLGGQDAVFFEQENISSPKVLGDDIKHDAGHKTDTSITRPFVVQLPDSGPVFPTSHHHSMTSRGPSIDISVSGAS